MTLDQKQILNQIKEMMEARERHYEANHHFQKMHAIKIMRIDIIERFEHEWVLSDD